MLITLPVGVLAALSMYASWTLLTLAEVLKCRATWLTRRFAFVDMECTGICLELTDMFLSMFDMALDTASSRGLNYQTSARMSFETIEKYRSRG